MTRLGAMVLCAGYGSRLGSLTRDTPKPLLPVGGIPLVAHTLRHLARHGVRDVAVNLHYHAERVQQELGDGTSWGVRISYEVEPELLGTAGGVRNLVRHLDDKTDVLVVYGDLLFDEDLGALYAQHRSLRADATLLIHERSTRSNSIIERDKSGRIIDFRERPDHWPTGSRVWVNSGCQVLRRELINDFPDRVPLDLPRDVYASMLRDRRFFGVPIQGHRIAVDSRQRYEQAKEDLRSGRLRFHDNAVSS